MNYADAFVDEAFATGHALDEAHARSGRAVIVLVVLAAMAAGQAGAVFGAMPAGMPGLLQAGDAQSARLAMLLAWIACSAATGLCCAWLVWVRRSVTALGVGLALVAANWVGYFAMLIDHELTLRGAIVNAIATYLLVSSFLAALRYHRLRRGG